MRISTRDTAGTASPSDESAGIRASSNAMSAPSTVDENGSAPAARIDVQGNQPTHILVDAVAHRIADTDKQGLGFGVIKRDGVSCIDESLRDRINVLSVSGSHDRLTVGSRLYRNDGKEAVLIIVES